MSARPNIVARVLAATGADPRRRFAERIQAALRASTGAQYVYVPDSFTLRRNGADESIFLGNMFTACQSLSGARRRHQIDQFVLSVQEATASMPDTFQEASPLLLPVVRALAEWRLMALHQRQQGRPIADVDPGVLIAGEFGAWLAIDRPRSLAHLRPGMLESWGVDFATAYAAAEENLRARTARPLDRASDGLYVSAWNDSYDSSRLLLPYLFEALPLDGEPIVMVPSRDRLLVADSAKPKAIEAMGVMATALLGQPRAISALPLRRDKGEWVPMALDPAVPEHRALLALRQREAGGRYAEQKRLLDLLHAKTPDPVFVGSILQVGDGSDGGYTITVWGKGMRALLPRVDRIGFKDSPASPVRQVPWDVAVRVAGSLMRPMGWTPERWLIDSYPDPAMLVVMEGLSGWGTGAG